ncbi:MAG: OmpA family protein, partial [Bacteroidales bacterium]|nr:OmpA family protein [Bacteroidales bacterium]
MPQKFQLVLSSFKGSFYMLPGGKTFTEAPLMDMGQQMTSMTSEKAGDELDESQQNAVFVFQAEIKDKRIQITTDERGVVITFASDVYFEGSSAELKDDMKLVLQKLSKVLKTLPNYFRVEGHTDNSVIPEEFFGKNSPTNWDLSTGRSLNVLKYLIDNDFVKPE